jgi:hypothetical protein
MLKEIYEKLDIYRKIITPKVAKEVIENKQNELGVKFPEVMVEFYEYYGNDDSILLSDFELDKVENLVIEDGTLCFGYENQRDKRLGIKLDRLDTKSTSVSFKGYNDDTWFNEDESASTFFFYTACWQLMMSMQGVVRVEVDDKQFKSLVGNAFEYLTEEKLFLQSSVIPVVTDDILGCYLVKEGLLYLGTNEEDEVLVIFEERFDLDLDWL